MTGSEPNHWNQRYLINKKKKIGSIGSWPRSRATNTSTWNNSVRQLHLIKIEGVILVRPPAKVEISKARSSLHSGDGSLWTNKYRLKLSEYTVQTTPYILGANLHT
jgi:hypothetical protein